MVAAPSLTVGISEPSGSNSLAVVPVIFANVLRWGARAAWMSRTVPDLPLVPVTKIRYGILNRAARARMAVVMTNAPKIATKPSALQPATQVEKSTPIMGHLSALIEFTLLSAKG